MPAMLVCNLHIVVWQCQVNEHYVRSTIDCEHLWLTGLSASDVFRRALQQTVGQVSDGSHVLSIGAFEDLGIVRNWRLKIICLCPCR